MRYTVNQAIEKLQQIVAKNQKIGDAVFGIATIDDDIDDTMNTAYDLIIDETCYFGCDGSMQFTIDEFSGEDDFDDFDGEEDY